MARSPYGRRFTLRAAAEFLDVTPHTLRALVHRRQIAFHQAEAVTSTTTRRKRDGTTGQFRRGSNYFFYETELLAYLARTCTPAREQQAPPTPAPVLRATRADGSQYADVSDLMPAHRRFA